MNNKVICQCLGGSHSYGLNTPESDIDMRGIFAHTDMSYIIGLNRYEHQQDKSDGKDDESKEFRHALTLLKGGNTQMIELLFNNNWIVVTDLWKYVMGHKYSLMDSENLFKCLMGYAYGELKLANGERTGRLGSKRKEKIDAYGFSPKNFCQLLRLCWAGKVFFKDGIFPVNVMETEKSFGELLLEIKTMPEKFTKDKLNAWAQLYMDDLTKAYDSKKEVYKYDDWFANKLCLMAYGDMIKEELTHIEPIKQLFV